MKNVLAITLICIGLNVFGQMEWKDKVTAEEKLQAVIEVDSASEDDIYNAILEALPEVQLKKATNKNSMLTAGIDLDDTGKSKFGGFTKKDKESIIFDAWEVAKMNRLYYSVKVEIKDNKYRLTITPVGTSGTALYQPKVAWAQAYKSGGEIKGAYKKYLERYRELMEEFAKELESVVKEKLSEEDDW